MHCAGVQVWGYSRLESHGWDLALGWLWVQCSVSASSLPEGCGMATTGLQGEALRVYFSPLLTSPMQLLP